jgi:hypothetical protein
MPYEDYTPLAFANVPEFGDARGELRPADAMTETIVPTLGNMVFTLGGRTKVGLPLRPCAPAPRPGQRPRCGRRVRRRAAQIVRDGKYTWCLAGVGGARLRVNSEWIVDFDDGGSASCPAPRAAPGARRVRAADPFARLRARVWQIPAPAARRSTCPRAPRTS